MSTGAHDTVLRSYALGNGKGPWDRCILALPAAMKG